MRPKNVQELLEWPMVGGTQLAIGLKKSQFLSLTKFDRKHSTLVVNILSPNSIPLETVPVQLCSACLRGCSVQFANMIKDKIVHDPGYEPVSVGPVPKNQDRSLSKRDRSQKSHFSGTDPRKTN